MEILQGYQMANLLAIFTKIGQFQKVLARRISLWPETYNWPIFGQFEKIAAKEIFIWPIGQFVAKFRSNLLFCQILCHLKKLKS